MRSPQQAPCAGIHAFSQEEKRRLGTVLASKYCFSIPDGGDSDSRLHTAPNPSLTLAVSSTPLSPLPNVAMAAPHQMVACTSSTGRPYTGLYACTAACAVVCAACDTTITVDHLLRHHVCLTTHNSAVVTYTDVPDGVPVAKSSHMALAMSTVDECKALLGVEPTAAQSATLERHQACTWSLTLTLHTRRRWWR